MDAPTRTWSSWSRIGKLLRPLFRRLSRESCSRDKRVDGKISRW